MPTAFDEIGVWSEVKLAIVKEYVAAYPTNLEANRKKSIPSMRWLYIDTFAVNGGDVFEAISGLPSTISPVP